MSATLRFRCYYCHRVHTVEETAAGKRGRCTCGKLMLVPAVGRRQGAVDPAADPDALPVAVPPAVEVAADPASEAPELTLARDPVRPGSGREALGRGAGSGITAGSPGDGTGLPGSPPLERRLAASVASGRAPLMAVYLTAGKAGVETEVRRSHLSPETKGSSRVAGALLLFFAIPVLGAWIFHQYFTGNRDTLGIPGSHIDPNYLNLPASLWSTLLLALFLALLLEGVHRIRRAREV